MPWCRHASNTLAADDLQGPASLVRHLSDRGYHPRSDAHSNVVGLGFLRDLISGCRPFANRALSGNLVAALNHTVIVNHQRWTIDLAVGPPAGSAVPPESGQPIRFAAPALVHLALEVKGVMTEHGKARLNRLRDLQAFHSHAHLYNQKTVALAIVVVNVAEMFWSALRRPTDITVHRNILKLGERTIDTYRNLPLRNEAAAGPGFEGVGIIMVRHDNLSRNPIIDGLAVTPRLTELVEGPPAPPVGDPLHYSTMLHRSCAAFSERWA